MDLEDNRSISVIWCTERIWKRRSPSSDYRRSEGIWRNWITQLTGFWNIKDVLHPIAHRKHCRFWSRGVRVTKDADFTTVRPESFGETRCIGRAGERGRCSIDSSWKEKFEVSFIWRSVSFCETQCTVFIWAGKLGQEFCVQETLIRRIWEDLFLKATRITCSVRRDQTWRSKSFMSSPSTSASVNLQRQTEVQRLALQDAQYGFVSPKYSNPKYPRNERN